MDINAMDNMVMGGQQQEETVEELMAKLAQKGQKVKLVKDDESPALQPKGKQKKEKGRNKENNDDIAKQRELEQLALQKQH